MATPYAVGGSLPALTANSTIDGTFKNSKAVSASANQFADSLSRPIIAKWLYVGNQGDITVVDENDNTTVFTAYLGWLPVSCKKLTVAAAGGVTIVW